MKNWIKMLYPDHHQRSRTRRDHGGIYQALRTSSLPQYFMVVSPTLFVTPALWNPRPKTSGCKGTLEKWLELKIADGILDPKERVPGIHSLGP